MLLKGVDILISSLAIRVLITISGNYNVGLCCIIIIHNVITDIILIRTPNLSTHLKYVYRVGYVRFGATENLEIFLRIINKIK